LLWGVADVLGVPVDDLVGSLPLAEDVTDALINGIGPLGEVLAMARGYEGADASVLTHPKVSPADLAKAYLSAVGWSVRTVQGVLGPSAPDATPPDTVPATA
jgi:c-di-GMP-related signal transduction protein